MPPPAGDLKLLFQAALALTTAGDRTAFLARECGADAALRARLVELLEAHRAAGEFLQEPAYASAISEAPGRMIDRYELIAPIGEGGFGTVWLAEQSEPVKRQVALKVVKLGMDTKQVLARFDAERQALALMEHPNIARVLDAGATEAGRPYFVMELIRGVPILEYCDREKLDMLRRLELFTSVCHAIQHAHQKGIIHRDIKPSNVLVTLVDGAPVPKVIDFGIAKATQSELTTMTLLTEQGQMVGTPAYMSPEQANMRGLDVDTRSDVYSLGVLLYEMLTGTTPFDMDHLSRQGFAEWLRVICEDEPHKPSTRISTLGDDATEAAAVRQVDVKRLGLLLRGDLDWIVMKCIEKDRARRYDSADGIAADIARHLADEPVLAGPPSRSYRLHKFARRNRVPVIAGALLVIVLVLGVVGTTGGMLTAMKEKRRANEAALAETKSADAARVSADSARAEAARAVAAESNARARADELEKVAQFQSSQLSAIEPGKMGARLRADLSKELGLGLQRLQAAPEEIETRQAELETLLAHVNSTNLALNALDLNIFRTAIDAVKREFADQPLLQARLMQTLALTMRSLGLLSQANEPQMQALEIRRRELGPDNKDTLASAHYMGALLCAQGRLTEAEPMLRETLVTQRRTLGNDHIDTLSTVNDLGTLLQNRGLFTEAEPLLREALAGFTREKGEDDPITLSVLNNLGTLLGSSRRASEAETAARRALAGRRRTLGDDHADTLASIYNLGAALANQGRYAEAETNLREALNGNRRLLGDDHPSTLACLSALSTVLEREGQREEAVVLLREGLAGCRRVLGNRHETTLSTLNSLGVLERALGNLPEAESLLTEAMTTCRSVFGARHQGTLATTNSLVLVLQAEGKLAEAEKILEDALEPSRDAPGADDAAFVSLWRKLGLLRMEQGRFSEAQDPLEKHLAIWTALEPDSDGHCDALSLVGACVSGQGRHAEAEPLLVQGFEKLSAAGRSSPRGREALARLIEHEKAWGKAEEAARYQALLDGMTSADSQHK